MYRVANASEYLVITGVGITDIKLAKKAWVLSGHSCTVFDLSPVNYTFEVQAMRLRCLRLWWQRPIPQQSRVLSMKPRLVFWTNGGIKEVAGVYKMLPLLFKAVHEQTVCPLDVAYFVKNAEGHGYKI
ncbi:Flotillin-like protein 1 [Glycine soja]